MRPVRWLGLGAMAALAISCDAGPKSGELAVEVATSRADLGALRFTVVAEAPETVDSLSATCAGCRVFWVRVTPQQIRGVLTGELADGPAFRVLVSNRKLVEAYSVAVNQAAARDYQLTSTANTRLEIPGQQ